MKKMLFCAGALFAFALSTQAQIIAKWTFETSLPAGSPGAGLWLTNIAAEVGSGVASGLHSGASTYSSPAGNGSPHSFSSTAWAVGDLYQFVSSSVGYTGLQLEWDQISSGTGPGVFKLQYSTDGNAFTTFGSDYTVLANSSPNNWSSGTPISISHYTVDLSSVPALDNNPLIYFRLVDDSTTAANGTTVAAGGTGRVDNFTLELVPEPSSLALLGGFGLLALLRKRAR